MPQILGWTVTLLALGVVLLIARLLYDLVVATALVASFALGTLTWSFLPSTPRRVVARVTARVPAALLVKLISVEAVSAQSSSLKPATNSEIRQAFAACDCGDSNQVGVLWRL